MAFGNIKNRGPDRLYIRRSDRKDYESLLEKGNPFARKENKAVFIMAMIIGFRDGTRVPLEKKEGYFRAEYLNSKELSVIKAIAVSETGSLDVLLDKKKVYSIVEEYAAGGIKLLKSSVFGGGYGSYIKRLEFDLVESFKKIEEAIK